MKTDKVIHVIHASDADQHLGNLQNILEALKNEGRIGSHASMESDAVTASSFKTIGTKDMVIMFLTDGITSNKVQIEEWLIKLKDKHSGVRVAQTIVDNLEYQDQFIAFPTDLEPIRSREDMDRVWKKIGDSLRNMFPADIIKPPPPWKKWVPYVVGFLVLGALAYWFLQSGSMGKQPKADFSYRVLDPIKGDVIANAQECYVPCKVLFNNKSSNAENLKWELKDTTIIDEADPEFVFTEPGEYKMGLLAINGKKENSISKDLKVKAPPFANFEVINNGCTAPCDLQFKNTSNNGSKYNWAFIGGTSPNASDKEDPGNRRYTQDGKFKVQLTATDETGIKADTIREITILRNNTPFADFTFKKLTTKKPPPPVQKFRFTSTSKNATAFRWEINKGTTLLSVKTTSSFDYTFSGYGTYSVKLIVTGGGGSDVTFKNVSVNKRTFDFGIKAYDKVILKDIMKTAH